MSVPPTSPQGQGFVLRLLLGGVVVFLLVTFGVAFAVDREADEWGNRLAPAPDAQVGDELADTERGEPQTILLVGDDHRIDGGEGDATRSDTMILVRLDPGATATTILSLPRDLLISPPGAKPVKLNSAFTKGPRNLLRTLKDLLSQPGEPFRIHHFVSIRFTAFAQAINALGCVYGDIDRRYFNDNDPPRGSRERYAEIDVQAGYQRLCGQDALAYVRYRHADSDKVREARQATFLADARSQVAAGNLVSNRDELIDAIAPLITTDRPLKEGQELLRLVNLALGISGHPTRRIDLAVTDAEDGGSYRATPAALRRAARQFLHPGAVGDGAGEASGESSAPRPRRSAAQRRAARRRARATPATIVPSDAGPQLAATLARKLPELPMLVPSRAHRAGTYDAESSRAYDIANQSGKLFPWPAYRLVVRIPGLGQNYGIQGTTWRDPPVLDLPSDRERLGGRTFLAQYDGKRIRRLVLRTKDGTYWVTNTLSAQLTNAEMRAIARSLKPLGR